jgi:hypothetical protein
VSFFIKQDLDALRGHYEAIESYVDRRIAHFDEKGPRSIPTFAELDRALDALGEIFQRYATLLTGEEPSIFAPVPDYDWLAPLRVAWLEFHKH